MQGKASWSRRWKQDTIGLKKIQQQTGHINNICLGLRRNTLYNLEDLCPLAFLNILDFDSLCYEIWETAKPEVVA